MDSQYRRQWRVIIKAIASLAFASFYAFGGIEHKWLRRFLAPVWLTGWMYISSWDWRVFLQAPVMMASLSLGYGADSLIGKIIRRLVFGIANGTSSSLYNIIKRRWLLTALQVALVAGLYVVVGVYNPFKWARTEEFFLGFMIAFIPLLSCGEED